MRNFIYLGDFMKKLYIIGGTIGVGKTTTCQILKKKLYNSVFLDGDWCWDSYPFQVTKETKKIVLDNICYLLNNFIHCPAYEHVIFCWVMDRQEIINTILERLDTTNCVVKVISLVCSEDELIKRLEKDVTLGLRNQDIIVKSLMRLPLYDDVQSIKIDCTNKTPEEVAELIAKL